MHPVPRPPSASFSLHPALCRLVMADMEYLGSVDDQGYTPQYQAQQPNNQDEEDEEDYDPSSAFPDDADADVDASQSAESEALGEDDAPTPADPSADASLSASTTSEATSQPPSRAASRLSNTQPAASIPVTGQKQHTIGGFVEEDDEEETVPVQVSGGPDGAVAVASAQSPQIASPAPVSQTPVPASVHVYNTPQDTGAPDVVPNGAVAVAAAAEPVSNSPSLPFQDGPAVIDQGNANQTVPAQSFAQPSASTTTPATSLPKARLPHDIVGQFEDRIKDDPKGDVDAWLGLVAHYRSKNKLDEARKLYSRFFEVFPTAVSGD